MDSLCQFIAIGGNTVFQLKDTVSILVDFIPGSCSQTDKVGIEIGKNIFVLVINTAVRFITHDKVKMSHGVELAALLVFGIVNAAHHGLIGRENTTGVIVFLIFTQIHNGQIGQQIHKSSFCLCDQAGTVSQEQNILNPTMPQQYIHYGNGGSCLARTRCHDQESFAAIFGIKRPTNSLNSFFLIVTTRNVIIHTNIGQVCTHGEFVKLFFQITL